MQAKWEHSITFERPQWDELDNNNWGRLHYYKVIIIYIEFTSDIGNNCPAVGHIATVLCRKQIKLTEIW